MICPACNSENTIRNGSVHNGKSKSYCKDCGRQFVHNSTKKVISDETWQQVDRLLLERISLAGIARVVDISEQWLQHYVNNKYDTIEQKVRGIIKKKGSLTIQCDEMWSFVGDKKRKQWIWLAIDTKTKQIIGAYIGNRSKKSAKKLWESLPSLYRKCAVAYTDYLRAYACIFPSKRHNAVGKESGLTNIIERFNGTVRQRVSRLVRLALSFSKKLTNHIGAVWNFIHHYNEVKLVEYMKKKGLIHITTC